MKTTTAAAIANTAATTTTTAVLHTQKKKKNVTILNTRLDCYITRLYECSHNQNAQPTNLSGRIQLSENNAKSRRKLNRMSSNGSQIVAARGNRSHSLTVLIHSICFNWHAVRSFLIATVQQPDGQSWLFAKRSALESTNINIGNHNKGFLCYR